MKGRLALTTLTLALAASSPAVAAVHHVPSAFPTVTAALTAAASGDTIMVAPGTYSPTANGETFPLLINKDGIHLLGSGAGISTLDAEGTAGVMVHDTSVGGRIAGFTVTGGFTTFGGGLWIKNGNVEVDHNVFVGNLAVSRGAGISVRNASSPWIHHNVIWENLDADTLDTSDPHGVIFRNFSTGVFEHNLVGRTDGNGLLTSGLALPSVRHNIFYENGVPLPNRRGRGICWFSDEPPRIFHNLFWANEFAALLWPDGGGDFSGTAANDVDSLDTIYGNLDGDPLFDDPEQMDFDLRPGSPAIDAGDPLLPPDPDSTIADIGPFYFNQDLVSAPLAGAGVVESIRSAPNPFRWSTDIRLSLARTGPVRVDVHDVSGRKVRTLHDGAWEAGARVLRWDGRGERSDVLGSGVYFVRVRTAGETRALPVVLLR